MKTLQEILREKWEQNGNNSYFDDMYVGERIAIEEAMKEYAKEVAKQALINASEKAQDMQYYTDKQEQDILGFTHRIIQSCYAVPKQSILNESNIPEL